MARLGKKTEAPVLFTREYLPTASHKTLNWTLPIPVVATVTLLTLLRTNTLVWHQTGIGLAGTFGGLALQLQLAVAMQLQHLYTAAYTVMKLYANTHCGRYFSHI